MIRRLLNFEVAILVEAGAANDRDLAAAQQVWQEYHAPPHAKGRQWFNTDFVIELNNWNEDERLKASSVAVRPKTVGADYFVMLTADRTPTMLELLEGESIPKKSFRAEIVQLSKFLSVRNDLLVNVQVDTAPYLRIARLRDSTAFVVATTTTIQPLLFASPVSIDPQVSFRSAGSDILIDGVICD